MTTPIYAFSLALQGPRVAASVGAAVLCVAGLFVAPSVRAGEAPVVRQVDAPSAAPAPSAARAAPVPREAVGDITRALLAAQADGRRAASEQPILGDVASATYQRYIESFKHPIPPFFEEKLEKSNGG